MGKVSLILWPSTHASARPPPPPGRWARDGTLRFIFVIVYDYYRYYYYYHYYYHHYYHYYHYYYLVLLLMIIVIIIVWIAICWVLIATRLIVVSTSYVFKLMTHASFMYRSIRVVVNVLYVLWYTFLFVEAVNISIR